MEEIKVYEFTYDGLNGISGKPFSTHYKEWIIEHIKQNIDPKSQIEFRDKSIIVDCSKCKSPFSMLNIVMFLGYAFGQQDNGR